MISTNLDELTSAPLDELVSKLTSHYYQSIQELSNAGSIAEYSGKYMLIREFLSFREDVLIPYLVELAIKSTQAHNCANCSGKCHIEHNSYFLKMGASHSEILSLIDNDVFINEKLKALLLETIYVESSVLLPAIIKAQTSINVSN